MSKTEAAAEVEKKLATRPEAGELVDHNILKSTTVSPALQGAQDDLKKEQTKNSLEDKLHARPGKDDVAHAFKAAEEPEKAHSTEAELAANALKLEHKLQERPDKEALVDRNIMHGGNVAPSIQQAQDEFKKAKIQDDLTRKLGPDVRPSPEDLVSHNIMKGSSVAPALQQAQEDLKRAQIADSVHAGLEHRPAKEDLVDKNILKADGVAPALAADAVALEHALIEDKLDRKVGLRPDAKDLVERGTMKEQTAAPALQASQDALKKEQTKDTLAKELKERPGPDDEGVKRRMSVTS